MGRTLPSITQAFLQEQASLARFRRALRQSDQRALDDLLAAARHHLAASAYASHLLPFEIMLLAMLVEEHKQVLRLQNELEELRRSVRLDKDGRPLLSDRPGPARDERAGPKPASGSAPDASPARGSARKR
jgi:hypothetical protein